MIAPATIPTNVAAGVTVAMVAIPLNLALAVSCGLPPAAGLISGAIAGMIGALFGGARINITGPEVALAPLTALIVAQHGVEGMLVATALAGLGQIALGALGVGRLVRAAPRPVVGGFLAAVGLLVFDSQLPHLVGLHDGVPISRMNALPELGALSGATIAVGLGVVAVMIVLPKVAPRVPAPLVGVAGAIALTAWLGLDVERIESVAAGALRFRLPHTSSVDFVALLPSALALAILASVDSLLCAASIDARTSGPRHEPDHELVAQGVANVACSLVGGMPVAAAVVRSVAAIEAGATTRLTGIVQSVVLLGVVLVLGPYLSLVPFAALAGVLLVVGAKLVGVRELVAVARARKLEAGVFLITAAAIAVLGFVEGLALGVVSALVVLARDAHRHVVVSVRSEGARGVLSIAGPLVFASQSRVAGALDRLDPGVRTLDVDLSGVGAWDASGLAALRGELARLALQSRVVSTGAVLRAAIERELAGVAEVVALDAEPAEPVSASAGGDARPLSIASGRAPSSADVRPSWAAGDAE